MNLQLKQVSESASIYDALGITDERAEELLTIMDDMYNEGKSTVDQLIACGRITNHPNELAFAAYICGALNAKNEERDAFIEHFNKFFDDETE